MPTFSRRPALSTPPVLRPVRRALAALAGATLLASAPAMAEPLDLRVALESTDGEAANRVLTFATEGNRLVAQLDARSGDGGALVRNLQFTTGAIELDIQGRNAPGQSFVGVAFNAHASGTHETVYFRPFNFGHQDPGRREHAVQYTSMPEHGWQPLREQFPQQYESAVTPEPKPDDWFHARIEVDANVVRVFVNRASTPTLTVKRLAKATPGRVGLWVGTGSAGRFANLEVTPAR